jgi:putative transposase
MTSNDKKILSHSQWNCKYHIVFAPKYRRKVFYESHRKAIMEIIRELCQWKGVEILEGEMAIDHVHLLVMIPPKMSVSGFMGYLKGKSSLIIYQKFGTVTYFYGHYVGDSTNFLFLYL